MGIKKTRWNVECLSALKRKADGLESSLIHSRSGCGASSSHIPPLCNMPNSESGRSKYDYSQISKLCTTFLPPFFTNFISEKLQRRKYMYFHFKKRSPKYVKHTGQTHQEWGQEKQGREAFQKKKKKACNGLSSSK